MVRDLPPDPSKFRDLKEWARQLYEFQLSQARVTQINDPLPLLLTHRTASVLSRATPAGIMLYDPDYETPVVSINGNWEPIRPIPLVELSYTSLFNVNGVIITLGGFVVPFNTENTNNAPWCTFNALTGHFTLDRGVYYLEGYASLSKFRANARETFTGYLARTSDLTTPVGTVSMGVMSLPSPALIGETYVVPFCGQVNVAEQTTYAMVVQPRTANTRMGTAHNIPGYNNTYARMAISLIGLNE